MAYPQGPTTAGCPPAERQFLQSVTVPFQAQDPTVDHKRCMTEYKIDYHVQRDSKGKESVNKVYLPSRYKGWVIMAEKKDAAGPEVEEPPSDISVSHIQLRHYVVEIGNDRQCPTFAERRGELNSKTTGRYYPRYLSEELLTTFSEIVNTSTTNKETH